ncbi:MAG TPA: MBL fold metallo-hydrolase [Prolixibacteraceae bacterium]|nr:MBL fold metallo-hydrolase [Prolixibacteraceae bacterium]
MKITFLGTGTSQGVPVVACQCPVCLSENPKDKRLRASVMIETDSQCLVVDAGPDFRQQMLTHKVRHLNGILLTHEHTDHIFGLDDIRAFNWVQKQPTDIYAEERVQIAIRRIFDYVFAFYQYPGIPQMHLHLLENKPFRIGDLDVVPIRGYHYKLPVFGFRFGKLAYVTDVNRLDNEELEKLRGLDILVLNALRKDEHISHFNLQQALEIIAEVKPEKAYLTHLSHQMGFHNEVQEELPENVFIAYDGLQLIVD